MRCYGFECTHYVDWEWAWDKGLLFSLQKGWSFCSRKCWERNQKEPECETEVEERKRDFYYK